MVVMIIGEEAGEALTRHMTEMTGGRVPRSMGVCVRVRPHTRTYASRSTIHVLRVSEGNTDLRHFRHMAGQSPAVHEIRRGRHADLFGHQRFTTGMSRSSDHFQMTHVDLHLGLGLEADASPLPDGPTRPLRDPLGG